MVEFCLCWLMILQGDSESNEPVVYDNGVTYMFVQHSNVYLMIASRQNCNAASLLFFLHRVIDVKHQSIPFMICFSNDAVLFFFLILIL